MDISRSNHDGFVIQQAGALSLIVLFLGGVFLFLTFTTIGHREVDLPPGPPTLPLIGNLHLMPATKPWLQFQKWAQEYGPIYSLILGTRTMIVLSTDRAVKDVLDRKSANTSDRPDLYLAQNVASGNLRLVLMKYGDTWRAIHRSIHNILNVKAAVTYIPYQDLENKIMLESLVDDPKNFERHIRRYTFSLSTQLIFGFRCPDFEDKKLRQLFWSFGKWGELSASASAQLVDLFPWLQNLPKWLMQKVRYAEWLHQIEKKLYVDLWMQAKRALQAGESHPCFCNDLLRLQDAEKLSDEAAAYTSGSLLEAGSDSTAATLHGFMLAAIVWPDVQKKAQEEIDRVVGPERLPTMEDFDQLPYVRCCLKESLRWMPVAILGVPHAALKDDEYMDYRIPAGSSIINNVWTIHMDPGRSPEPRRFNPDRFGSNPAGLFQSATGDYAQRDNYVFGAGRRLCQGIHIAERSLFLAISRLMWAFDVSGTIDDNGNPFKYDIDDIVGSITVEPNHFPAKITPRSAEKVAIIRREAAACRDLLDPRTRQWKEAPKGMAFSTYVPNDTEE